MNFNLQEYETYRLEFGDILLNEGQSKELVGRPAIYRGEVPAKRSRLASAFDSAHN
jgi:type I restriction enzyme S subunit